MSLVRQAVHPQTPMETSYLLLKLLPMLLLILLRSGVVPNAQKRNESNIFVLTLMWVNSKHTEFFVPHAISGFGSGQTQLIVPFLGTLIAKAVSPRKCKLQCISNLVMLNDFLAITKMFTLSRRETPYFLRTLTFGNSIQSGFFAISVTNGLAYHLMTISRRCKSGSNIVPLAKRVLRRPPLLRSFVSFNYSIS